MDMGVSFLDPNGRHMSWKLETEKMFLLLRGDEVVVKFDSLDVFLDLRMRSRWRDKGFNLLTRKMEGTLVKLVYGFTSGISVTRTFESSGK